MAKKKHKPTTKLIAVPKALVADVLALVREEQQRAARKGKPINRKQLVSDEDEQAARDCFKLIANLRKPLKRVKKVAERLENVNIDDLSHEDDAWHENMTGRFESITNDLEDLVS